MKTPTTESPASKANSLAMIIGLYPQAFALATRCDSRTGRMLQHWNGAELLPPCPPAAERRAETFCRPHDGEAHQTKTES